MKRDFPRLRVSTRALYILGAAVFVALVETEPAAAVQTFVSVVPSVSSASLDTGEEMDLAVLPVVVGARGKRASLRAMFPYLDLSARTPPYRIGGPIIGITIPAQELDEHGPGDIVLAPAFLFVNGGVDTPSLWGTVRYKAPTADESKYLGTGEADYAPGFALTVPTGTRVMAYASARYNIRGDPPEIEIRDTVSGTLAAIVRVRTLDAVSVLVARDDARFEGGDPANSVGLAYYHPFNNGTAMSATGLVGEAGDARIYGIAIGFTYNDGPYDWGY